MTSQMFGALEKAHTLCITRLVISNILNVSSKANNQTPSFILIDIVVLSPLFMSQYWHVYSPVIILKCYLFTTVTLKTSFTCMIKQHSLIGAQHILWSVWAIGHSDQRYCNPYVQKEQVSMIRKCNNHAINKATKTWRQTKQSSHHLSLPSRWLWK